MRFLMLNWRDPENPKAGGAERVTRAFLAALVQRGHEAYWFTYDFEGARRETTIDGITVVRGGGMGTSIREAVSWYRRQARFDLVIDQHHGIPWYAPWWCKTHCIAYIHEVLGPIWGSFYPWPLSWLGRIQERWTHWLYRDVPFWVPSESTGVSLRAHGVRSVTVLPNGVDTLPVPELEPKLMEQPLRLITVSRLAPNKRIDHALRTVRILVGRGVDARLTVVGGGEDEGRLRRLSAAWQLDSRVTFTGPLEEEEKNRQLRRAHFLIHTSLREGWGLNVLEANAMGTPAVVYPVGGLVDSTVDNKTGVVAPTESPELLADCLQAVLPEPSRYAAFRQGALERARAFQWERVLPPVCDWLEQQAAGRRA